MKLPHKARISRKPINLNGYKALLLFQEKLKTDKD